MDWNNTDNYVGATVNVVTLIIVFPLILHFKINKSNILWLY